MISALFLVINGRPDDTAIPGIDHLPPKRAIIRHYRKRGLNREMTSDLLGPGWWRSDDWYGTQYQGLSQLPGGAESEVTRWENEFELVALFEHARVVVVGTEAQRGRADLQVGRVQPQ